MGERKGGRPGPLDLTKSEGAVEPATQTTPPALAETESSLDAAPSGPVRIRTGAPQRAIQPGDRLGDRYVLIERIGAGAMGQVFRARDERADEIVAIKLLTSRPEASVRGLERVRRELRAARKVTHPGVVRLHDLLDIDGQLALSMELVEGEDLAAHLKRRPRLPADELIALATDLARALAAAHRAGVVHRDIKPANVIVRRSNGRAVITDFGVSRIAEAGADTLGDDAGSAGSGKPELTREGDLIGRPCTWRLNSCRVAWTSGRRPTCMPWACCCSRRPPARCPIDGRRCRCWSRTGSPGTCPRSRRCALTCQRASSRWSAAACRSRWTGATRAARSSEPPSRRPRPRLRPQPSRRPRPSSWLRAGGGPGSWPRCSRSSAASAGGGAVGCRRASGGSPSPCAREATRGSSAPWRTRPGAGSPGFPAPPCPRRPPARTCRWPSR